MLGLGKLDRPKVVAFDIIGTVFPLEPLRADIARLGLPPSALEGWFAAGCRDAFALAAAGDFEPFATVLDGAPEQVAAEHGRQLSAADRKALLKRLEALDARADAADAFHLLRRAGIGLMALSNGSASSTRSLLDRAGLRGLVEHVVSIDEVKLSKPRVEVYRHAARIADIATKELALVAAHAWDINGASAAGLVTGYLRSGSPFPKTMRKPTVDGASLTEIADRLAQL